MPDFVSDESPGRDAPPDAPPDEADAADAGTGGREPSRPRTWAEAADSTLRRAATFGDIDAFHEIVGRHGPAMLRYASRTLNDRGDAEEAVQDAFVAAWRTLPDFRGDSTLRTWLFTITRRKAIDLVRRKRPLPVTDDELLERAVGATPGPSVGEGSGFVEALDTALAALPESQRSVWLLREVEEMSYAEIAQVQRTTETAVRGKLARARAGLQTMLEGWKP